MTARPSTLVRTTLVAREGIAALQRELDMPSLGSTIELLVAAGLSPEGLAVLHQTRALPRTTTWDSATRGPRGSR